MNDLFLKTLNMSIAASWLVLAVLIIRVALKNAPKWVNVFLWGIVAIRLICPFSIESTLSLIPSTETIPLNIGMDTRPEINSGIDAINNAVNPIISQSNTPAPGASVNPLQITIGIYEYIWIFGMIILALYTIVSYCRLRRKVDTAIIYRDNIFQSENVSSPFVLGIIKPRIYLPFKIEGQNLEHVIAHEQAHIRRKDHWWKPFGFFLLTIHWFNPLMWLAYVVLCRDIELACDEKVIKELENEQRADYTQALVSCSVNRRMIAACPLAFGEVGVKERVKSIMNYKKPTFWIMLLAFVICAVVAVCFLTNPSKDGKHGADPFGHAYKVEEILFSDLRYSFDYSIEDAPRYQFTSDFVMFVSENIDWVQKKGGFKEVKITTENFDNYFYMSDFQISNDSLTKFRRSIKKAWRIDIENDENNVFYYLIYTKSKDVYLTYGYHDPEGETDIHSDDSHIRWMFKLSRTDLLTCNALSEGIDAFVELACFPDKIDRDTNNWPVAQINESGVLQFSLVGNADTLIVSEDYYKKSGSSTVIVQDTFEIVRNDEGFFTIDIARRESIEDHVNYFIKIKGQSDVYTMKVVFDTAKYGETESMQVVTKWFDYFDNPDKMEWDESLDISLPEFPNVTFRWSYGEMVAVKGNEITSLYTGMPIWNTYFCDLTGDGLPELCSTISWGSGMIDDHIIIYDYANGVSYSLEDRGIFDYVLRQGADDEQLYVDKSSHAEGNVITSGKLVYLDNCIQILNQVDSLDAAISTAILERYKSDKPDGLIHVESHVLLEQEKVSGTPLFRTNDHVELTTVYLLVHHVKYSTYGGNLEGVGGSYIPTAITFKKNSLGEYICEEYWEPRDGSDYAKDIRNKFPGNSAEEALNDQAYIEELKAQTYNKALEYLRSTVSLDEKISMLLDEIQSSPSYSSNTNDYIREHKEAYEELISYGDYTLQYCFNEFLEGSQNDLRGNIMSLICQDITNTYGEALLVDGEVPLTGQEWFESFRSNVEILAKQYSHEDLKKYYPTSFLLLQMTHNDFISKNLK